MKRHVVLPLLTAVVAIGLLGLVAAVAQDAPPQGATAFVVNDATTSANASDLVQVGLGVPSGFNHAEQTLWAPPGFSVSLIAAGLKNPRFMTFDANGNLLVAAMGSGNVYRYPAANGSIDPAPRPRDSLISGLESPSNVALFGGYLKP